MLDFGLAKIFRNVAKCASGTISFECSELFVVGTFRRPFERTARGHVTQQTDPLGRVTSFAYTGENFSASGGTTTITDPNGNVEIQRYVSGELVSLTRGAGTAAEATWSFEYDPDTLGRTKITDPNGHTTVNTFDPSGNLTSTVDPLGRTITSTYNALNEPTAVTDPSGVTTTSTYDSGGNLTSVSRPLSAGQAQTETLGYGDGSHPGDVTSVTDANGKTTAFAVRRRRRTRERDRPAREQAHLVVRRRRRS